MNVRNYLMTLRGCLSFFFFFLSKAAAFFRTDRGKKAQARRFVSNNSKLCWPQNCRSTWGSWTNYRERKCLFSARHLLFNNHFGKDKNTHLVRFHLVSFVIFCHFMPLFFRVYLQLSCSSLSSNSITFNREQRPKQKQNSISIPEHVRTYT